ncbi:MAG: EAL domain-containing protein [Candidatus Polarisedimenticolaceae bacterium]|nr:EAL domain-containing protein [Candidatus Polarisedimenticolaceae bacterium]
MINTIVEAVDCGLVVVDQGGSIVLWNEWMTQHSGISNSEVIGNPLAAIFPQIKENILGEMIGDICCGQSQSNIERLKGQFLPLYKKSPSLPPEPAKPIQQQITLKLLTQLGQPHHCLIQIFEHIPELEQHLPRSSRGQGRSMEKHTLQSLKNSLYKEEVRTNIALSSISDGVIIVDAKGRVELLNLVAEQLTGWKHVDAKNQLLEKVLHLSHELQGGSDSLWKRDANSPCMDDVEVELTLIGAGDAHFPIELSVANIEGSDHISEGSVIVFRDISQSRKMAAQLLWNATHDLLTGLENRLQFERRLEHMLENAKRYGKQHALLYLDLDQFKIVNDTCGHIAGDELLRRLTNMLKFKMRESDMLTRLGGDEFGILLEGCPLDAAVSMANELRNLVNEFRFNWEGKIFSVGLSIGLVVIDEKSTDVSSLLSTADAACYSAKDSGRNRVHVYDTSNSEAARRRGEMQWLPRIHRALEQNMFELYGQRIEASDPDSDAPPHIELLLRMHEEGGVVIGPGAFIPAAERYNLMSTIDRWVVENGLEYLATNPTQDGCSNFILNINLSGASLAEPGFLEFMLGLIKKLDVPTSRLCFEVTETAAIANLDDAIHFISSLKEVGCSFALDDFGSGFSSFAYLKHLPVDYLKIDGGFVKDMLDDPIDRAMVEAINRVGHVMGIKTVAEFVENGDTLEALREAGVDYVQGYHIDKPHSLALWIEEEQIQSAIAV